MFLKLFRIGWYVSVAALVANLLYVYASLPVSVTILEDGLDSVSVSRETSFHTVLAVIALINACVFFFGRFYKKEAAFRAWFYGLVISLNVFFIVAFSFIGVYNSGEHYDFPRLGLIVMVTLVLFVVTALAWPVYAFVRRISGR